MLNSIYKRTYRGRGIYWHPGQGYGDETQCIARTMQECRNMIDAAIATAEASRPDHLKFWDGLSHQEREKWRKLSIATELSAPELAFTNRPL